VTASGCILAAAGAAAGGVLYYKGDLETTIDGPPDKVIAAADATMKEMQYPVISKYGSGLNGQLVARTGGDKKLVIKAESMGANASKVNIRIGTFGDEAMSRHILEKIKAQLPTATTQPAAHVAVNTN
jgi:hypothetical protein